MLFSSYKKILLDRDCEIKIFLGSYKIKIFLQTFIIINIFLGKKNENESISKFLKIIEVDEKEKVGEKKLG